MQNFVLTYICTYRRKCKIWTHVHVYVSSMFSWSYVPYVHFIMSVRIWQWIFMRPDSVCCSDIKYEISSNDVFQKIYSNSYHLVDLIFLARLKKWYWIKTSASQIQSTSFQGDRIIEWISLWIFGSNVS